MPVAVVMEVQYLVPVVSEIMPRWKVNSARGGGVRVLVESLFTVFVCFSAGSRL